MISVGLLAVVALTATMTVAEVDPEDTAEVAVMTTLIEAHAMMIVIAAHTDVATIMAALVALTATHPEAAMIDIQAGAVTITAAETITMGETEDAIVDVIAAAMVATETHLLGKLGNPTPEVDTELSVQTIGPSAATRGALMCSGADRSAK